MTRRRIPLKGLIPGLIPFVAIPILWSCRETPLEVRDTHSHPSARGAMPAEELVLVVIPESADLQVGDYLELGLYWREGDDFNVHHTKFFRWVTADPEIALVDEDGLVQALAQGTVSIAVECEDGWAEAMVTVR